MKLISLAEAVAEIKGACSNTQPAPFFYIVGAGISSPPIPRANEIVQICQEKVEREEGQLPSTAGTAMDEYSFWLQQAYRQPADRPTFLRSLMEGKPLSRANWRLAHLLSAGKIGNVVVTPNFDDMLARALTMLGLPHILCDHPATASRIDEESAEIQILHVHGTYRFYDCCNLSGEIEDRANSLASRMDTLLARRSPLIVGYSGWGKDVIMQAIKRRLEGGQRLPRYLYWFCYSRSSVEDLPLWLRQHQDVCFVVPSEIPTEVADQEVSKIGSPILPASGEFKSSNVHRLAAQTVFDALIKAFEVPAPDITRDPLGFFATQLRQLLLEEADEEDPYLLLDIVDRIERAKNRENQEMEENEQQIEEVLELLRSTKYENASEKIAALKLKEMSLRFIEKLIEAVRVSTRDVELEPELELRLYQHSEALLNEWLLRNETHTN